MTNTKVSVIIPIYNAEAYLEECIQSVINQSLKEIEIICVNDGSTDASEQILRKFSKDDERVRIITKENTGYGHSVNLGIAQARGEYIDIVESDDYIPMEMLEELYEIASKHQVDVIKANRKSFEDAKEGRRFRELAILPPECSDLYHQITNCHEDIRVFRGAIVTWAGIYRRSFLSENNIWHNETPGASYQDNGFWFQVTMHAKRMYFVNKAYYNVRRDNPNSSVYSKQKVFCMCEEYDFIRNKILAFESDLRQVFLAQQFYYRYKNYLATMERIAPEYLPMFYERMRHDFIKASKEGEIDISLFTKYELTHIYSVIRNAELQDEYMDVLNKGIGRKLDEAETIVLYGAGRWGIRILNVLQRTKWRDKNKVFVVSEEKDEVSLKNGLAVVCIDTYKLQEQDLVIVAAAEEYVPQMIRKLREKEHTNYIYKNELCDW